MIKPITSKDNISYTVVILLQIYIVVNKFIKIVWFVEMQ